ncbi:MAG: hypothetical protein ACKVQS_11280 [Fimbriimonadaceae bacterium]
MKSFVWLLAFGVCLIGCAGEPDEVTEQPLTEWQQLSVALKPEVKKGDLEAYSKLIELAKAIPAEMTEAMNTPQKDRVAGQKANLVAYGQTFEEAVRKLVEGESWVIALSTKGSPEERLKSDIEFEELAEVKKASKLLLAYSEVVEEGGNPELAARACLTNRMLGKQMLQTDHLLMTNLVAVAVNSIAEKGIRLMATKGVWSKEDLVLLQGKGWVKNQAIDGLIGSVKSEWWNYSLPVLSDFQFPEKDGGSLSIFGDLDERTIAMFKENSHPFNRKATIELGVKIVSTQLAELETMPLNLKKSQLLYDDLSSGFPDESADESAIKKWAKSEENAIGKLALSIVLPILGQASLAAVTSEAGLGLSEVVLAAQRGLLETGTLPGSFEELAKFGLPDDVVDPFSGKAFGYDPVRGIAWSVGSDGVDSGGVDEPERWTTEAKDWVVRLK